MAIPWSSLKSLLIFFAPWLMGHAVGYYKKFRADVTRYQQQQRQGETARLVRLVQRRLGWQSGAVLAVVVGAATAWILSSGLVPGVGVVAPWLAPPENVFVVSRTRLQAPSDVVFSQLARARGSERTGPDSGLSELDLALRARFGSLEARLTYLQLGPNVLVDCLFCTGTGVDSPQFSANMYLLYALVDLVAGHLANLVLITVATSPLLVMGRRGRKIRGAESRSSSSSNDSGSSDAITAAAAADSAYDVAASLMRRSRVFATAAALAVAVVDVALVVTYERQANARTTRAGQLDGFYWRMRHHRGLACGLLLAVLATVQYFAVTGQHAAVSSPAGRLASVLVFGPSPAEAVLNTPAHRVAAATRLLAGVKSKLNGSAVLKNTVLRDADLRARMQAYWAREVMLVAAAMEERDVVESVNDALLNRIAIQNIERDADTYARSVIPLPATSPAAPPSDQPQQQRPLDKGASSS